MNDIHRNPRNGKRTCIEAEQQMIALKWNPLKAREPLIRYGVPVYLRRITGEVITAAFGDNGIYTGRWGGETEPLENFKEWARMESCESLKKAMKLHGLWLPINDIRDPCKYEGLT